MSLSIKKGCIVLVIIIIIFLEISNKMFSVIFFYNNTKLADTENIVSCSKSVRKNEFISNPGYLNNGFFINLRTSILNSGNHYSNKVAFNLKFKNQVYQIQLYVEILMIINIFFKKKVVCTTHA